MSGCDVCIGTSDVESMKMYSQNIVKARKPAKCCECRRPINKGDKYEYVKGRYDGDWYVYRTCALCVEIRTVFTCGKGFYFETLWEDMADYAFERLTTASECFTQLSPAAKAFVLERWRNWKGL